MTTTAGVRTTLNESLERLKAAAEELELMVGAVVLAGDAPHLEAHLRRTGELLVQAAALIAAAMLQAAGVAKMLEDVAGELEALR